MSKIILFYGSFNPIHTGHLKIALDSLKLVKGDKLYFGLNKTSNLKNLAPFSKRKKMIELTINGNNLLDIINIPFDYKNLEETYNKIFSFCKDPGNQYYILIGDDQIDNLKKWYKYDELKEKFKFIIATRNNKSLEQNSNFIYLHNKIYNISSENIRKGNYKNLNLEVKQYIIQNNIYLKEQLVNYMSKKRLKHVNSVKTLALKIYKNNKKDLQRNKIITACLLHDIAKEYPKNITILLMKRYYKEHLNESYSLYHQYIGEYLAKKKFFIEDKEILQAIKYHTSATSNMSQLAKLVYCADKIDPLRAYDSKYMIDACLIDLNEGFKLVLKDNIDYLKSLNLDYFNEETSKAIKMYLKG